jgi:hypothetical protein
MWVPIRFSIIQTTSRLQHHPNQTFSVGFVVRIDSSSCPKLEDSAFVLQEFLR